MKFYITSNEVCNRRSLEKAKLATWITMNHHELCSEEQLADYVICSSCAYDKSAEDAVRDILSKVIDPSKTIVTGCFPNVVPSYDFSEFKAKVDIDNLASYLDTEFNFDIKFSLLSDSVITPNENMGMVFISHGCLSQCSFCGIKDATKQLTSRSIEDIISDINNSSKEVIYLLGEDTGVWGLDNNQSLPDLLNALKETNKKYYLDGMSVDRFLTYSDSIIEACRSGLIIDMCFGIQHFHSDIIIHMRRVQFDKDAFFSKLAILSKLPVNVSAQFIYGYPAETDEHFMYLIDNCKTLKQFKVFPLFFKFHRKENCLIEESDLTEETISTRLNILLEEGLL
jgi:tRNA A37 methylthiotransferase MiaB